MNKLKKISETTRQELKESLKLEGITNIQIAEEAKRSRRAVNYFFSGRNNSRCIKDACIKLLNQRVHDSLVSVAENQRRISQLQTVA